MIIVCGLLLAGFSIFSCLLIALIHFRSGSYSDLPDSRRIGVLMLLALALLQLEHANLLLNMGSQLDTPLYRIALFSIAPCFYFYCSPLVHPLINRGSAWRHLFHVLPMIAGVFLPFPWAFSLAFVVGSTYLLWFANAIYQLRSGRAQFRLELALLGGVFMIALIVAVVGLLSVNNHGLSFIALYASAIGVALFLVQLAFGLHPTIQEDVTEVASHVYRISTLSNVDCNATLAKLEELMTDSRLYQDAELSLAKLAGHLKLAPHQLSELFSTQLGKGFSRYLRERRVSAACAMLLQEPSASVLSVGLSVGFASQSNFYEAFRELQGMTPGAYRKLHASKNLGNPA